MNILNETVTFGQVLLILGGCVIGNLIYLIGRDIVRLVRAKKANETNSGK
jgi:hypothetical protein